MREVVDLYALLCEESKVEEALEDGEGNETLGVP